MKAGAIHEAILLQLKLLKIKQHLADYKTVQKSTEIIKPDAFSQAEKDNETHKPPEKETPSKIAA